MLKKWADPRRDEVDAKTLSFSILAIPTPESLQWFWRNKLVFGCSSYQVRGELKRAHVTKNR